MWLGRSSRISAIPLLVLLTTKLGFEKGLHIAVAMMLAVMTPVLLALRQRPEDMGLLPDGAPRPTEGGPTAAGPRRLASQWSRRGAVHDRAFLTISIPFALGLVAQVGFLTHQISYLLQFFGPQSASLAVSLTTAAAVVGRTITGFFVDRLDRRILSSASFMLQMVALGLLLLQDRGRGDAANHASVSRPKNLSPIGLSSRFWSEDTPLDPPAGTGSAWL